MKAVIVFTAIRIIEVGQPEPGQSEEEFLQCYKEATIEDPFSFIDTLPENIDVACSVQKVKE